MADVDWDSFEPIDSTKSAAVDWDSFEVVDKPNEKPVGRGASGIAGDLGSQLARGVNTMLGAIPNLIAPDSDVAKFFERNSDYWQGNQSELTKSLAAAADEKVQEAAKNGMWDAFKTGVAEYGTNPVLVQKLIAENIVSMIPGVAAAKGAQALSLARGASVANAITAGVAAGAATNAAMNAGGARQGSFQEWKETLMSQGRSEEEATAMALEKSRLAAAVGGIAGAVSGGTGLERGVLGAVASGGVKAFAKKAGAELAGEQAEELLPQLATNLQIQSVDPTRQATDKLGQIAAQTLVASGPGSVLAGVSGRDAEQQPIVQPDTAPEPAPLMIENKPDPFISFPDGTVGKQSDVDNWIATLPENEQLPARARLLNIGEPAAPTIEDIGIGDDSVSLDQSIATAQAIVAAPTEIDIELKNKQIDQAFSEHMAGIRQRQFDLAEQARRDADVLAMQNQAADQQVEQANALTQAQGFDAQEPTAMELAMQTAQQRRELLTTPVSQRAAIVEPALATQATEPLQQEVINAPAPTATAPVLNDGTGSAVVSATQQPSETQGLAPVQAPIESGSAITAEAVPAVRTGIPDTNSTVGEPAALEPKPKFEGQAQAIEKQAKIDAQIEVANRVAQAKAVLDKAGIKGKERLDIQAQVRAGDLSIEDLSEAYPAQQQPQSAPSSPDAKVEQASADMEVSKSKGQISGNIVSDTSPAAQQVESAPSQPTPGSFEETAALAAKASAASKGGKDWIMPQAKEKQQKEKQKTTFSVGRLPNSAEPVTVRDGVVHVGEYPAQDFDTGDDVTVPESATNEQVRDALVKAGSIGRGERFFGLKDDGLKSTAERTISGLAAADVAKATTRVRAKWLGSVKVNTVQSLTEVPVDVVKRAGADEMTEGLYDPQTKTAYVIADNIASPERAVWVAVHETVGHGGLRMLKDKTVNQALNIAGLNRFVRDLASAIKKDRGDVSDQIATEEAIAELAAATDTNDFQALADRYGVTVPESAKNGIRGTVARVFDAIRRFLSVVMSKPVADVSDADVRNLIKRQRDAVEGKQSVDREVEGDAVMASTRAEKNGPSKAFGTVAGIAKKAYEGLSSKAKIAVDAWNVNWSTGSLEKAFQSNNEVADEIRVAFDPVREKLRSIYGDSVPLYRGEFKEEGVSPSSEERKLFSWSPLPEIANNFATNSRHSLPTPITDEEITKAVAQYERTGYVTFRGRKLKRSSEYPGYFDIYDRHNNIVTDGDNLAELLRGDQAEINQMIADMKDAGNVYYADVPIDKLVWIPTGGNLRQPEIIAAYNPRKEQSEQILQSRAPTQWTIPDQKKILGVGVDDFLYRMQDKTIDTRRAVEAINKLVGKLKDEIDPRLQETLFAGRSSKQTHDFAERELKPLMLDMRARGVDFKDFEEFLHARHAKERNEQIAKINPKMQDKGSGMSTADANNYMTGLRPEQRRAYDALASRIDKINEGTRKLLVESGLEKQSTIDAWDKSYKHYVPLQRAEMDEPGMGTGQGFSVKGASTKRALGSEKEVIDIIANIALQRERAIVRSEKSKVSQAVYGLSVKEPNADFWLSINPRNNANMTPAQYQEMEFELIALGLEPEDAQLLVREPKQRYVDPRTGLVSERINPTLRSAPNVLAFRVNGEDRFVVFNTKEPRAQRMVTALKNLDADQMGAVLSASAMASRWFAQVNTQWNPVFGMMNLTRDVQSALLNLSTTEIKGKQAEVLKHTASALLGIYSDIRAERGGKQASSKWADLYEEFQKEGGKTGFRQMFSNSQERMDKLRDEITQISEGKIKHAGRAVFSWLSDYNEALENAVRLAAYKVGTDNGMSKQRAAAMAKELTVNFNRKGQVALQAGALYAFFNAAVQGTARTYETLTGPMGKKILAGGLILGSMQAIALAMAGFDDDEPPQFVRERSLILPVGNGKYISIPMPLGFHVIPSMSRIVTEWALSGGKETAKRVMDIGGLFADAFNPIGNAGISMQTVAPTALDPFTALIENKDFAGRPIAREDMSGLRQTPGYTRAKDTASFYAKELSYYLNLMSGGTKFKPGVISPTPDQIDYLIGQVGGGTARELSKVEQLITSTVTGEELPTYKMPLVGRLYGDTESKSAESSKFYANIKLLNSHKLEIEGRRKEREPIADYIKENPEAKLIGLVTRTQSEVSELNKLKRKLLERDAPKDRIKLIESQITAKMKRLNDRVESAKSN